jgi:hypothetical protein
MSAVNVELCPETGICSIIRANAGKADLMPDEVQTLRKANGDAAQIRAVLAESDSAFAASLSDQELRDIAGALH